MQVCKIHTQSVRICINCFEQMSYSWLATYRCHISVLTQNRTSLLVTLLWLLIVWVFAWPTGSGKPVNCDKKFYAPATLSHTEEYSGYGFFDVVKNMCDHYLPPAIALCKQQILSHRAEDKGILNISVVEHIAWCTVCFKLWWIRNQQLGFHSLHKIHSSRQLIFNS